MKLRSIARWHEREDVILCFDGGVEIPATQVSATGRLYFRDGHGRTRTIDVIGRPGEETYVLDAFGGRKDFGSSNDLLRHLEEETGPAPRGRVTIVGQVGGQLVYACSPVSEGAGQ